MELLAPAGGMKELIGAVQSGADAVYLGATEFSARAGAGNFTMTELKDAVEYAHGYGVKVHCALNTLIKETELDEAVRVAVEVSNCGVDAIIIQDVGLASHLRKIIPDTELHASTQMTVATLDGVKYLEEKGFSRVVLSRELSLREIEEIAKGAKAEIEVFVHGAICMSYSGQCLMSSILGGRSGNRGRCAQPCRLEYDLLESGKVCDRGYVLSPKDMALISHLDKLKKAGVSSLKIEGRRKSAEYVSAVVGVYRKYLDAPGRVTQEDMAELVNAFSRSGFTDGYLTGRLGKDMMAHQNPANNSGSTYTPEAKARANGEVVRRIPISVYGTLKNDDVLRLTAYDSDGHCVNICGDIKAEPAQSRPIDKARLTEQLSKVGATPFKIEDIEIDTEQGLNIPIKEINRVRRSMCDSLWAQRCKKTSASNEVVMPRFEERTVGASLYMTAEVATEEQGISLIKSGLVKRIFAPSNIADKLSDKANDVEIVSKVWGVLGDDSANTESVSVSSLGDMYRFGSKARYGEYRLNVYNSLTANELSALKCVTLSPELNLREATRVIAHTKDTETEIIAYGRLPLMTMRNCPIKAMGRCQKGGNIYSLRDRKGMEFPVICSGGCRAVLLNSKPVFSADIIDEIKATGADCIRLCFTIESPDECAKTAKVYDDAIKGYGAEPMAENTFTRGHMHRGVN